VALALLDHRNGFEPAPGLIDRGANVMWFLLTRGLKWFGIALAVAKFVAPRRTERLTGVGSQSRLRRPVGPREVVSGIGRGRRVPVIGLLAALAAMSALRRRKAPRVPAAR
jgi:hypothetical protein